MTNEAKENKDNMVALRLNNEQLLTVKQWAYDHDTSVSQVIRLAIQYMTQAKA